MLVNKPDSSFESGFCRLCPVDYALPYTQLSGKASHDTTINTFGDVSELKPVADVVTGSKLVVKRTLFSDTL